MTQIYHPLNQQVECLGDLQGPKFRVGELAGEPVELKNGEIFEFHGSSWWLVVLGWIFLWCFLMGNIGKLGTLGTCQNLEAFLFAQFLC